MLVFVLFALRVLCACSRRSVAGNRIPSRFCTCARVQTMAPCVCDLLSLCIRGETRRERLLVMYLGEETWMS